MNNPVTLSLFLIFFAFSFGFALESHAQETTATEAKGAKQYAHMMEDGMPAVNARVCSDDMILMQSPSQRSACVFPTSVEPLQQRGFEVVVSPPQPMPIPQTVAAANNAFAVDFYRQVQDEEPNLFFSSSSMSVAFSVLYEGAKGNTAQQIRDVFGLDEDEAARHEAVSDTMSSLNRYDPYATLEMANSLWLRDSFKLHESYVDVVRNIYRADIERGDFGPETVKRINGWASEKTREKITEVVLLSTVKNAVLVIANAIYFKGTWVTQFSEEDTHESEFWNGTNKVKTDFMNIQSTFGYAESDGVQLLRMPYKGDRLSMLVVLPSERDGIAKLQESLSAELLEEWQQKVSDAEVVVSFPKFEMKTNYDLKKPLKKLGITDAFSNDADLSGISNSSLFVSKATQDAYVNVNEEGTEAAAVTIIVLSESLSPPLPRFIADHPFIFAIQDDESGAILFMGRVSDPTA